MLNTNFYLYTYLLFKFIQFSGAGNELSFEFKKNRYVPILFLGLMDKYVYPWIRYHRDVVDKKIMDLKQNHPKLKVFSSGSKLRRDKFMDILCDSKNSNKPLGLWRMVRKRRRKVTKRHKKIHFASNSYIFDEFLNTFRFSNIIVHGVER